jgi:hypothetical protein
MISNKHPDAPAIITEPHEEWETFPTTSSPPPVPVGDIIVTDDPVSRQMPLDFESPAENPSDQAIILEGMSAKSPDHLLLTSTQEQTRVSNDPDQISTIEPTEIDICQTSLAANISSLGCERIIVALTHLYLLHLRSGFQFIRINRLRQLASERVSRRFLGTFLHAWSAVAAHDRGKLIQMTNVADLFYKTAVRKRLLLDSLAAWVLGFKARRSGRLHGGATVRRIFNHWRAFTWRRFMLESRSKDISRSVLGAWNAITLRSAEVKLKVDAGFKYRILGPALFAWISYCNECRNKRFLWEINKRYRISTEVLHAWSRLLHEANNNASISSMSPSRQFGILIGPEHCPPTSPEAWLEELPAGLPDKAEECGASIPDSVEHYIIHDSPKVLATASVKTISTDVISEAQVFLSQRRLRNQLPFESLETPRPTYIHPSHPLHQDSYSSWFERKWATEESLWGV